MLVDENDGTGGSDPIFSIEKQWESTPTETSRIVIRGCFRDPGRES